jgi:predicted phosphodiesterase
MKILALSDKIWPAIQLALVEKFSPDVIAIAGDVSEKCLYKFLERAGRKARVLVVAGNHDEESKIYDPVRINRIKNCQEISGRLVEAAGFRFFGLSYSQAMDDTQLSEAMPKLRKADILITHAPLSRLPKYCWRGPKIVIQGHHGHGVYYATPTTAVFTDGIHGALVEWNWPLNPLVTMMTEEYESLRFTNGKPQPPAVVAHFRGSSPLGVAKPRSTRRP